MARRHDQKPQLKLDIWIPEGNLFRANPASLREVIECEGVSEEIVRSRMGYGYSIIQDLLDGKSITIWAANMVEHGIIKG